MERGTALENQAACCRGVARNLIRRHWERGQTAKVVANSAVLEAFLERVAHAFAEVDDAAEEWAARQQALNECAAALPERSRRVLSLRYESRASMQELARATASRASAVWSWSRSKFPTQMPGCRR